LPVTIRGVAYVPFVRHLKHIADIEIGDLSG